MLTPEKLGAMTEEEMAALYTDLFRSVYGEAHGAAAQACRELGMTRSTHYNYASGRKRVPWPILMLLERMTLEEPDQISIGRHILDLTARLEKLAAIIQETAVRSSAELQGCALDLEALSVTWGEISSHGAKKIRASQPQSAASPAEDSTDEG